MSLLLTLSCWVDQIFFLMHLWRSGTYADAKWGSLGEHSCWEALTWATRSHTGVVCSWTPRRPSFCWSTSTVWFPWRHLSLRSMNRSAMKMASYTWCMPLRRPSATLTTFKLLFWRSPGSSWHIHTKACLRFDSTSVLWVSQKASKRSENSPDVLSISC